MACCQIIASLGAKGNQASKEIILNRYLSLARHFGGGPFIQCFDIGGIFITNRWMSA
jgi:hypothetical protein